MSLAPLSRALDRLGTSSSRLFSQSVHSSVWLPEAASNKLSLERSLALGRLFLTLATLVAGSADSSESDYQTRQTLVAVYSTYSLGVLTALWLCRRCGRWLPFGLHAADVFFSGALSVLTDAPSSYFLPFFVLLAAAVRWGSRETHITGALMIAALIIEGVLGTRFVSTPARRNHLLTGTSYFLVVTILVGHLSDWEKRQRVTALAAAQIVKLVRPEAGLASSLRAVLRELRSLFNAASALLVIEERDTGRLFLWSDPARGGQDRDSVRPVEVSRAKRDFFLFPIPSRVGAWSARQPDGRSRAPAFEAIDARGDRLDERVAWPDALAAVHGASALLCLPEFSVEGFRTRLFLFDPDVDRGVLPLRLLQSLAGRVGPVLHNLFLTRRLRSRIEEHERARVAHELHDGVIQSLVAIELQVDVLRRTAAAFPARAAADLGHVQRQLREQIVSVRELMQQLRPRAIDSGGFLTGLSQATERFVRGTGIQARFVSEVEEIPLPPRVCRELTRVVEEALVNVRKHSGALDVLVRAGVVGSDWALSIEDDGKGFAFTGRLEQTELDLRHLAPAVISARLRSIGGRLAIDSRPGRGSKVEVFVPRSRYS